MRIIERSQALKTALIVLVVSACLSLPAYFIHQSTKVLIIHDLNKNALNIASAVATFLEQDMNAFRSLPANGVAETDSSGMAYFKTLVDLFDKIKRETGAAKIYAENRVEGRRDYLLRGPFAAVPELQTPDSGTSMSPLERRVVDEGINILSGLMRDEIRGEYIIGYAPVIDGQTGETAGIVGVEFPLQAAQRLITRYGSIIWMSFFLVMLLISFVIRNLINSRRKYFKEDYLTGLFNKRYLDRSLRAALCHAMKKGRKLSVIMVDVDLFKSINDTFGHTVGDSVLKSVAARMKKHIRFNDTCCRYGGDEFVITLFNAGVEQAFEIAERIRSEINGVRLLAENGEPVGVSLSLGVAEFNNAESAQALIGRADKAMYFSKTSGKNRTTVYTDDLDDGDDSKTHPLKQPSASHQLSLSPS